MKKILCITIPRSGHCLLLNLLLKYFSGNMKYPEIQGLNTPIMCKETLSAGDLHYCEYYNHCRKIPCIDPHTNFQKNHDYDLSLENNPNYNYIIQFRHPVEVFISWYKFRIKYDKKFLDLKTQDIKENWIKFIGLQSSISLKNLFHKWNQRQFFHQQSRKIKSGEPSNKLLYWKNFVYKWIINNPNPNTYYLSYYDLIKDPIGKLKDIITLINPEKTPNIRLIHEVVKQQNINYLSTITNFKHWDKNLFKRIEREVSKELKILHFKDILS